MSTWEDLAELRLIICDPIEAIAFETVAERADLPDVPVAQTLYRIEDESVYAVYDADLEAWNNVQLHLADATLNGLIDAYGVTGSAARAVKLILVRIGRLLNVTRADDGATSTQYQTLADAMTFYKGLIATLEDTAKKESGENVGRFFHFRHIEIGGGI
jgi:hypothetical protein